VNQYTYLIVKMELYYNQLHKLNGIKHVTMY